MDIPIDDLIALNRAATVARLLAGTAHEVNNALLVISGSAELLEDAPSPAALSKGLTRIRTQSARAAAVITDVLAFARGSTAVTGRVNLREIAASAVNLRAYAISRAGLKIAFSAATDRTFVVEGSAVLLLQAILNLIANAEQALAAGRGSIDVQLTATAGQVALAVLDSGPGVPLDERSRIFLPHVTIGAAPDGFGLGLPAARAIAARHGGSLDLELSATGAAFVMYLPLA